MENKSYSLQSIKGEADVRPLQCKRPDSDVKIIKGSLSLSANYLLDMFIKSEGFLLVLLVRKKKNLFHPIARTPLVCRLYLIAEYKAHNKGLLPF